MFLFPLVQALFQLYTTGIDTRHLQPLEHVIGDLVGGVLAAQVGRDDPSREGGVDGGVDLGSGVLQVHELEHDSHAAQRGDGVGLALAHNVGGAPVDGLANGEALADVGAGDQAQRAQQAGALVGQDVAVQVGRHDDVVELGLLHQLEGHRVDNLLVDLDAGRCLGEGLAGRGAEEPVGLGQDVGLVDDGDLGGGVHAAGAAVAHVLAPLGDLAGHLGDAVARAARDALDGLGLGAAVGAVGGGGLLLDVQVLGVLAHNDHVDVLLAEQAGGDALDGTDVGEQVELLAQGDDGGRVALDGGRGGLDGAEEGAVAVGLEDADGVVGEGGARLFKVLEAGVQVDKGELEAEGGGQGLEEAAAGGDDLLADAVAGDEAWEGRVLVSIHTNWCCAGGDVPIRRVRAAILDLVE